MGSVSAKQGCPLRPSNISKCADQRFGSEADCARNCNSTVLNASGRSLRRNAVERSRIRAVGHQSRYFELAKPIAGLGGRRRCFQEGQRNGAGIVGEHGTDLRRRGITEIGLMVDADQHEAGRSSSVAGLHRRDRMAREGTPPSPEFRRGAALSGSQPRNARPAGGRKRDGAAVGRSGMTRRASLNAAARIS